MTHPIVTFVRAQLAEDEQVAKTATPGPWLADPTGTVVAAADLEPDGQGGEILPVNGPSEVAECYRNEQAEERGRNAEHTALHDPDRELAEVAAKRRILELHMPTFGGGMTEHCETCGADCYTSTERYNCFESSHQHWPCTTLLLLAAPYADRDGYDPAWAVADV